MRVKKFTGPSLKNATDQMRNELGSEAVILSTRTLSREGGLHSPGKEMFEVMAAVDDVTTPQRSTYNRKPSSVPFGRYLENQGYAADQALPLDELKRMTDRLEARSRTEQKPLRNDFTSHSAEVAGMLDLQHEVESMRGTLRELCDQIKHSRSPEFPPVLLESYSTLLEHDVDEDLARRLIQSVFSSLTKEQIGSKAMTEEVLLQAISSLVKKPESARTRRKKTRIVVLVGPTGVGKTTTIAKLAAIHKLLHKKSVGLISTDTYRIGAIEQLKTFAAIADIPMEVVYKPAELPGALRRFHGRDLVLVDTVGRSHRSKKEIAELGKYIDALNPDETHLVLSASTAPKAINDMVERFKVLKPNRLLFTKLDEAASLGPLLNVLSRQQLSVGYVTTGQRVPDDILAVEPAHLASMIYSGATAHA